MLTFSALSHVVYSSLDESKHSASRDRSELEDRIRTVEHSHALLESQYQKSLLEFNHNLATKQTELNNATNTLRATQMQLQDANPDILKQIEYVKDDLTDLFISEPMYLEYKAIDRHRQTIREYVCCSVYELVRAEKNAKESMHKELEMIRAKLIKSEDECDRNARERDQLAKLKRRSDSSKKQTNLRYRDCDTHWLPVDVPVRVQS
jgi:chromosome segregation ATPase